MLTLDTLQAYCARTLTLIPFLQRCEVAIEEEELAKFMQEHKKDQNILMLALWPSHNMAGTADAAKWENICGFYFLIKTDWSALKRPDYLKQFSDTQAVAKAFAEQLLIDQAENYGCGLLADLEPASIKADPIKALNQCNGYYLEFSFKSQP